MASNPPSQCCTIGVRHDGEPTGKITTVHGIECYISEPEGSKVKKDTAILYIPDAIGLWQNAKLLADQYAANGYYCFMPDIFNGDPVPVNRSEDFDWAGWFAHGISGDKPHTKEVVDKIVATSIKHLCEEKGFKKIGAVGYCFGGKYVVRFLGASSVQGGGIDVGYIAHPSFVNEEELAAIGGPLSISAAEVDVVFPPEKRHKSEEILKAGEKVYQINLFQGTQHGFAVRCDLAIKTQRFAKEQAFLQAIAWFDEFLN